MFGWKRVSEEESNRILTYIQKHMEVKENIEKGEIVGETLKGKFLKARVKVQWTSQGFKFFLERTGIGLIDRPGSKSLYRKGQVVKRLYEGTLKV